MLRYEREDGCRAWLARGWKHPLGLAALLEKAGTAGAVYDRTMRDGGALLREYLPEADVKALLDGARPEEMHRMMLAMREHDIAVIAADDGDYPPALSVTDQAPVFLFAVGDPSRMRGRCLTVVGSRQASPRAVSDCRSICRELSERGVTVVSGMAVGIDTAAHEGSLQGGTPGIGVLGCGLDVDYPAASRQLKRDMLDAGGLLIGECPPGTRANRWAFPMRNRILSGLSKGVAVIECRARSGTMSTVGHALDQGREVFARPGEPGSVYGEGTRSLLRDGARFFETAEDLLEDLGWETGAPPKRDASEKTVTTPGMNLILRSLHTGVKGFDELIAETGLDTGTLSISLTLMQMSGLITALPGKTYAVV